MKEKRSKGQSLVEWALVLPLLLLILLAIFDLGGAFGDYIALSEAARQGAYYGSMHPTDLAGIRQRVREEAAGAGLTITDADITITAGGAGEPIRVSVDYVYHSITTYVIGSGLIPLRATVEMVVY
ncbi:MAG: pilus assembly protein [Chloroflexi bacterium]|nr:pilus assembly protein [Chloroflexota bacterium]